MLEAVRKFPFAQSNGIIPLILNFYDGPRLNGERDNWENSVVGCEGKGG